MARPTSERLAAATVAALVVSALAMMYFGTRLGVHEMQLERAGFALSALVMSLGFGLVVSRALVDPAPRAAGSEAPGGSDPRLVLRSVGLALSVLAAGIVVLVRESKSIPGAEVAAIFYGFFLGSSILFAVLMLRRVYPPQPAPPVDESVGALFGTLLEPGHVGVIRELVERGEIRPDDLPNAGYDEVARWLATRGESIKEDPAVWKKRLETERRRHSMSPSPVNHGQQGGSPMSHARAPGWQQRGAK